MVISLQLIKINEKKLKKKKEIYTNMILDSMSSPVS